LRYRRKPLKVSVRIASIRVKTLTPDLECASREYYAFYGDGYHDVFMYHIISTTFVNHMARNTIESK
jgi:hypothetical protein